MNYLYIIDESSFGTTAGAFSQALAFSKQYEDNTYLVKYNINPDKYLIIFLSDKNIEGRVQRIPFGGCGGLRNNILVCHGASDTVKPIFSLFRNDWYLGTANSLEELAKMLNTIYIADHSLKVTKPAYDEEDEY